MIQKRESVRPLKVPESGRAGCDRSIPQMKEQPSGVAAKCVLSFSFLYLPYQPMGLPDKSTQTLLTCV